MTEIKKMFFDTVFFDLDGTLSDSAPGIINSIRYALEKAEYPPLTDEQLLSCVGPPLAAHLAYLVGVDMEEGKRLQSLYREYYSVKGIYENSLYDGVKDMLSRLFDAGCKMYICTGKPEKFARIVLEYFDIAKYFTDVLGTSMDGKHSDKSEALATLLTRCDKGNYLFVGDREFDVIAARACFGAAEAARSLQTVEPMFLLRARTSFTLTLWKETNKLK